MKYYKFLTSTNRGEYSGFDYSEYLPKDGKPGKWLPEISKIEMCKSGYHACNSEHLIDWINAQLFEVEFDGEVVRGNDKTVGHKMRFIRRIEAWNDKTARLFAVWCAREALKFLTNPDPRSVTACDVAERYALGKATEDELAAAWDAAWAAARAAARTAAMAAAWDAVRAAAWDAAWDAAWVKQTNHLIEMLGIKE